MPGNQIIPRPADARPGGPALWEELAPAERKGISLDRVVRAVQTNVVHIPEPVMPAEVETPPPAAVLIPLFEEDGETRVVLTRRSANLRSHTGEVSFPGGRIDAGEDAVTAALREAREEV